MIYTVYVELYQIFKRGGEAYIGRKIEIYSMNYISRYLSYDFATLTGTTIYVLNVKVNSMMLTGALSRG
jgi:hypothetical protein